MGVDPKRGAFFQIVPKYPVLSPLVLFCPDLSLLGALSRTKEDKQEKNGTFLDNLGNAAI